MGCNNQKEVIKVPPILNHHNQAIYLKEKLLVCVNTQVENFDKLVQKKIDPNYPKNISEFNEIINKSIEAATKNFGDTMNEFIKEGIFQGHIKFFERYLISTCRSKEGFYRNQNDFISCTYIFNLIRYLLQKIESSSLSNEDSVKLFTKLAKGTYAIKGLSDLYTLLEIPVNDRCEYLENVENTEKSKLLTEKTQLIEASDENFKQLTNELELVNISHLSENTKIPHT